MLIDERQKQIKELLVENDYLTIPEIAKRIYASTATVRRDLIVLESLGLIRRVRGGAKSLNKSNNEINSSYRYSTHHGYKTKLGSGFYSLLKNDATYFIDASTTVESVLKYFERLKNVQIFTNGINNAAILANFSDIKTVILGGELSHDVSIVGEKVIVEMAAIRTDFCIFSCKGLTVEGPMEGTIAQREVKSAMIHNSKEVILLVDHTKFDSEYLCFSCAWNEINYIVTDEIPDKKYLEIFEKYHIKLIISK